VLPAGYGFSLTERKPFSMEKGVGSA
jgi:hypothetical protein